MQDSINAILREALEQRHDDLVALASSPAGLSDAEKTEFRELPIRLAELRTRAG